MTKNEFKRFLTTSANAFFNEITLPKALNLINGLKDESILGDLSDILLLKKSYGYKELIEELEFLLLAKAQTLALNSKIKFKNEKQKNSQNLSEFELLTLYFYKKLKGN